MTRTLLAEERQRADRYLEASTIWQSRALQLEERLQALEAGPITGDADEDAPQDAIKAPLRGDVAADRGDTVRQERPWRRRLLGR